MLRSGLLNPYLAVDYSFADLGLSRVCLNNHGTDHISPAPYLQQAVEQEKKL